jgi:hypothetical protein
MTLIKSLLFVVSGASLVVLTACSGAEQPISSASPEAAMTPTAVASASSVATPDAKDQAGGIVVESGGYHLELKPEKEGTAVHLDLFLQKSDTHVSVPDAKIKADVQLPDGSKKTVAMVYDSAEKHYTAKLAEATAGEYKVAVQSDIGGEKINARFNFKE